MWLLRLEMMWMEYKHRPRGPVASVRDVGELLDQMSLRQLQELITHTDMPMHMQVMVGTQQGIQPTKMLLLQWISLGMGARRRRRDMFKSAQELLNAPQKRRSQVHF